MAARGAARRRSVLALALVVVGATFAAIGPTGGTAPVDAATSTPVMRPAQVSAADLAGWYRSKGKANGATESIDALASYYVAEGADEGVAGDLAFAQSIVETGYFGFSARVPGSSNNFSGLGAVDGGTGAAQFADARTGVRAQIQHLRAYGDPTVTAAKLAHPVVDPRFGLVSPKGKAPTWEQFGNGIWATDPGYATKVLSIYQQILTWSGVSVPVTTTSTTAAPTTTTTTPPPSTWTPFTTADALVTQGYRDLLAREATGGERAAGIAALDGRIFTPSEYLATLLAGEGEAHAEPIVRLYLSALGRLPDRGGLQYWTRRHVAGTRLSTLAGQFLTSSEFVRRYGHPSDLAFVEQLYRNVLGRVSDPAGADYWARRIQARRITRAGLLVQFSESDEHVRSTQTTAEASVVYLGMVLRAPDPSVLSWWSTKRSAGSPLSTLTDLVYGSTAYRNRFLAG